jgi:hypothetical protein
MVAIKLSFKNETRRGQINLNNKKFSEQENLNLSLLIVTAQNLFPALRGNSNLNFKWVDEDGDIIVVSSDDELTEASRLMSQTGSRVMAFKIEEIEMFSSIPTEPVIAQEINTAVHHNVREPRYYYYRYHILSFLLYYLLHLHLHVTFYYIPLLISLP